jgi:thiazole synthase ThiGH ThiG subunit
MTNFPITLGWDAIIMITAISGATTKPLRMADQ